MLPHILDLNQVRFATDKINRSGRKERRRQWDDQLRAREIILGCLANT